MKLLGQHMENMNKHPILALKTLTLINCTFILNAIHFETAKNFTMMYFYAT